MQAANRGFLVVYFLPALFIRRSLRRRQFLVNLNRNTGLHIAGDIAVSSPYCWNFKSDICASFIDHLFSKRVTFYTFPYLIIFGINLQKLQSKMRTQKTNIDPIHLKCVN